MCSDDSLVAKMATFFAHTILCYGGEIHYATTKVDT